MDRRDDIATARALGRQLHRRIAVGPALSPRGLTHTRSKQPARRPSPRGAPRRTRMALPLIPSSVVGSHGKPGWWFATVKAYESGEYGPADLDEMFDDAADTAIRDMERAGVDIITDGEVRRLDGYVDSYYASLKGIEALPGRRE